MVKKEEKTTQQIEDTAKKEEEPDYVEALEFDKFCDSSRFIYRKGIIALLFGQDVYTPSTILCRIWIDPKSAKEFCNELADFIKIYEKKYGVIE